MEFKFSLKGRDEEETRGLTANTEETGSGKTFFGMKIVKAEKPQSKTLPPFFTIDIGSRQVKVISGQCRNGKISIRNAVSYNLPDRTVYDGKLMNVDDAVGCISNLLNENGVNLRSAVLTMDSTEVIQREIAIPKVNDSEIAGVLSYEMGQFLPIDSSSYSIQYKRIGEHANDSGVAQLKLNVCAMPKTIARNYMELFARLRVRPIAMDIHSNAVGKLIKFESAYNPYLSNGSAVVIDMGHTHFNVMFFNNGRYLFSRLTEVGGSTLDEVIARAAGVNAQEAERIKKYNLSKLSALEMYKAYSSTSGFGDGGGDSQEMITQETTVTIEQWISNIDSVIKYYVSRNKENAVDKIFIYGGCSYIKDIDKLIEERLNIRTERLGALKCLEGSLGGKSHEISRYINAVGAMIRI